MNKKASLILFLVLLTACNSAVPMLSSIQAQNSSAAATSIDGFISTEVEQQRFSGTVLIAQAGRILLSKGYGWADEERRMHNQPLTRFRIGSITKQFTAMAILLLQEQGKVHVQDRICRYIASCPVDWQAITIQQLLTHTSGIPDYTGTFPKELSVSPEQLISFFREKPLDFPPGTHFRYSNAGYVLLGDIIENIAGKSYADFLHETILRPLHLNDTGFDQNTPSLPRHATGYIRPWEQADSIDMSVPFAAGALYSTIHDLYRWDEALFTHTFASKASLEQMFAPQASWCNGQGLLCSYAQCVEQQHVCSSYGYGWFLYQEQHKQRTAHLIEHRGNIDGFLSNNRYYPDQKVTVIILSNIEAFDPQKINHAVEAALLPH